MIYGFMDDFQILGENGFGVRSGLFGEPPPFPRRDGGDSASSAESMADGRARRGVVMTSVQRRPNIFINVGEDRMATIRWDVLCMELFKII